MRGITTVGPALVVLTAAAAALFAAPAAVRQFVSGQTSVDVTLASKRLESETNILESINSVQRDIARVVEPSVVHVSTTGMVRRRGNGMGQPFVQSGSGWIWDDKGHIVTNAHVVDGAERIEVQLHDGELRDAELVGRDIRTDIAVLKIEPTAIHPAHRGNSDELQQGDLVYAFGSPFDFRFSMSSGIVSGLGRTAGPEEIDYQNFIQVDAAINPGNSGGPLTDIRGRVVGMNTAIATGRGNTVGQGQFAGIGLAIPMSMIDYVVTQLIETGEVRKGFLGVRVEAPDMLRSLQVGEPTLRFVAENFKGEGAVVTLVDPKSPALKSGLRVGDVLLAVGGRKITSSEQVPAIISSTRPGTDVTLDIWRANLASGAAETTSLIVTLGELDPSSRSGPFPAAMERVGLEKITTATEQRCRELDVPFRRGVLVETVTAGSEVEKYVPAGSIIVEVLEQPVGSVDEFFARVDRYLTSLRNGRMMTAGFLQVPITVITPTGDVQRVFLPLTPR
ncbi:MAG: trypsin-like peptidase domain-containing protein [Phycisphaerae bacterium]|nr:trypsin-like peptidase domain-containing protein [Phycisphaerae bacterium]